MDAYHANPIASLDITSISLNCLPTNITVYSVYNPPNTNSSINTLHQSLAQQNLEGHLLIFGDFNKYHPLWAGPLVPLHCTQRSDCDSILHLTAEHSLHQCLRPGTPTFYLAPHNTWTTLDLAFILDDISDCVTFCPNNDRPLPSPPLPTLPTDFLCHRLGGILDAHNLTLYDPPSANRNQQHRRTGKHSGKIDEWHEDDPPRNCPLINREGKLQK